MPAGEQLLDDLAGAVLDGAAVDWAAAESSAGAAAQPLVRHLRLVASVARLHRDVLPTETASAPPPAQPDKAIPDRWGHLLLLECVGRGAFGEVFRAWDTRLDREVALKLLPAAPSSQTAATSIIQEGRLLAKVRHPNVVTIHGAEQIGNRIGLWMEFVRGHTLEQLLQRGTTFRAPEVIGIGVELCRAVSAVHAAGLLHRDIKAHNVTRAEDGRVVLMDFGAGKELDDSSSSDLTGTPLYLAPEVLAGGPATLQSDIYSLGVLLYHLATGAYPVHGRTIRDIRRAHERHERVALRTAEPALRPALARVIERATDPQPTRRYKTVDALARDLAVLQRRPAIVRVGYGVAASAAFLVGAGLIWDASTRRADDRRNLASRLVSLIAGAPTPAVRPVIVVLPFRNTSRERGLLVDSLTAGLIQQLGSVNGLEVISQTSSFMLRDKEPDFAHVRRLLSVNHVVQGDATLSGNTLVIRAALIPIAGGDPLWNDTLTREVRTAGDLTDVLAGIARTIVDEFGLTAGPIQRRYATTIGTYEKYLKARELRGARGWVARDAVALFEEVIREDPSFAPAQAALAATYGGLGVMYPAANLSRSPETAGDYTIPPGQAAALMRPLAEGALGIDPGLAEAHAAMGFTHALEHHWVDAEASFRRAIALDPTITAVYGDFVVSTLQPWGRLNEALATLEAALQADPLSLDLRRTLAHIQLLAGRHDDALQNCQRVVDANPDFPFAELICIRALLVKGRTADALDRINKHPNLDYLSYFNAITGQRAAAEAAAAKLAHLPYRQASLYTALGDMQRAVEAFERFAALNPTRAAGVLGDPELARLRREPRVEEFRRTLGFPN
jgi:serine/threonine-protein kinase